MARGHFRTPKDVCVYCGFRNGEPMPYKTGAKNNPTYLCEKCMKNSLWSRLEKRGIEELHLDNAWKLTGVHLDKSLVGWADIELMKHDESGHLVYGSVKYSDL